MVISCIFQAAGNADITIRTPLRLAVHQCGRGTQSGVIDTFRLLIDSVDLSEEDSDGWEVLDDLCIHVWGFHREKALSWTIRQLSFELKTNFVERHFASMLSWLFVMIETYPERSEALDLLLNLGGHGIINAPFDVTTGYAALHEAIACYCEEDNVSAVVARGPDLHRRGLDTFYTPFEESPTSLAMYSASAFSNWLHALANVHMDLENLIDQELELNHEVHIGWKKETLVDLFSYGDRPDLYAPYVETCSDCSETVYSVRVQPYWQHILKRIKRRLHPYDPVTAESEVDEKENVDIDTSEQAASSSTDLIPKLGTTGNVPPSDPEEVPSELESESETGASEFSTMTQSESVCLYDKYEIVCIDCWLHYERTGTRRQPGEPAAEENSSKPEDPPSSDDSSECEYSPFLIHS